MSPLKTMAVLTFILLVLEPGPKYLGVMPATVPQQATRTELRPQLLPSHFITSLSSLPPPALMSQMEKKPKQTTPKPLPELF